MNQLVISLSNPPTTPMQWLIILCAFAITIPQGIFLFRDAQKRGRFPWLWGLWGVMSAPLPLIFYYIFVIRKDKKREEQK